MKTQRRTADEQYQLIMECRSSGLSDYQWCTEHNINPGTFYNWVKKTEKKSCDRDMLGDITVADEIYVICGYTDMRKSIDGLCAVVKDQLNMNPSRPNAIYLFCGRRSDRIKVLLHEREGFVLLYKRLDANVGKYRWPRNRNEVKPITWRQFDWLMSGLEIEQPKAIKSTGNA